MRSFRTFLMATALVSAVALSTTNWARSGEKRSRVIPACGQPTTVSCTPITSQPSAPTQTCCQPTVASVQPKTELVAYARPAASRRLAPQPDQLDIGNTTQNQIIACAQFESWAFPNFYMYIAVRCQDTMPVMLVSTEQLSPVPDDCGNPGGGCQIIYGTFSSTANDKTSSNIANVIKKGTHLSHKFKAGMEPSNRVDAQATGPYKLKERTRVGEPTYIKFSGPAGESIVAELQKCSVKGTGKASRELSGTFAIGFEVDAAPVGVKAKAIDPKQIQVVDD